MHLLAEIGRVILRRRLHLWSNIGKVLNEKCLKTIDPLIEYATMSWTCLFCFLFIVLQWLKRLFLHSSLLTECSVSVVNPTNSNSFWRCIRSLKVTYFRIRLTKFNTTMRQLANLVWSTVSSIVTRNSKRCPFLPADCDSKRRNTLLTLFLQVQMLARIYKWILGK